MTTAARRRPLAADLVVPVLDAVVEGSWIALVYVTVQVALAHAPAALGPLSFAIAAGLGLAWSRAARGRLAGTGILALLAFLAGLVGWLADPGARASLAAIGGSGGLDVVETAITTNAAGWLLALAVVRGASHEARARDEERTGRLLGRILLLAVPWAVGLAFAGDDRPAFIAQATLCTLLFAGAGLLAVGLGRLETSGSTAGVDWRQNRSWVAVVAIVVALMLAVSLPAAFLVGVPPLAIVDAAWVSVAAVVGLVGAVFGVVGAPILAGVEALMNALPTPEPTPLPSASAPPAGVGEVAPVVGDPRVGLTLTILALVAISILLVAIVARIRTGSGRATPMADGPSPVEERSIERPRLRVRLPAVRLARPRRSPATAPTPTWRSWTTSTTTRLSRAGRRRPLAPMRSASVDAVRWGRRRASWPGRRRPTSYPPAPPRPRWTSRCSPRTGRSVAAAVVDTSGTWPSRGGPRRRRGAPPQRAAAPPPAAAAVARPRARRRLTHAPAATWGSWSPSWELVRYAGRALTPAEDARGVGRWRRLRATLRRGAGTGGRSAAAAPGPARGGWGGAGGGPGRSPPRRGGVGRGARRVQAHA